MNLTEIGCRLVVAMHPTAQNDCKRLHATLLCEYTYVHDTASFITHETHINIVLISRHWFSTENIKIYESRWCCVAETMKAVSRKSMKYFIFEIQKNFPFQINPNRQSFVNNRLLSYQARARFKGIWFVTECKSWSTFEHKWLPSTLWRDSGKLPVEQGEYRLNTCAMALRQKGQAKQAGRHTPVRLTIQLSGGLQSRKKCV